METRPGVKKEYLVKRRILLLMKDADRAQQIVEDILEIMGVNEAFIDSNKNTLSVSYDASRIELNDIEKIVRKYDSQFLKSRWSNFKISWYRFTDENIKSNARHVPRCCGKSPK